MWQLLSLFVFWEESQQEQPKNGMHARYEIFMGTRESNVHSGRCNSCAKKSGAVEKPLAERGQICWICSPNTTETIICVAYRCLAIQYIAGNGAGKKQNECGLHGCEVANFEQPNQRILRSLGICQEIATPYIEST